MDLQSLQTRVESGERFDFLFFWGHTPKGPATEGPSEGGAGEQGPVGGAREQGPWVFSQWWDQHPFEEGGDQYATAEHFMMAEKARLMGDGETRAAILAAKTPAEAKKLGRRVSPWDQAKWEAERAEVVVRGNQAKFTQHPALGAYLRSTGERVIVEASPNDAIWGIGLAKTDAACKDPRRWKGLNLLGFALMTVRSRLVT